MTGTFLIGAAGACVLMTLVWRYAVRARNAGVVDVAWAAAIGGVSVWFALAAPGWGGRRFMVGIMALAWSLRLAGHLWRRVIGKPEDGRYATLRAQHGAAADGFFFWFFQAQAVLAALLCIPFLVMCADATPTGGTQELLALVVATTAEVGVTVADRQLAAWRRDAGNRGRTCRSGLWAWSRHPNYFFEWLVWCSFALAASQQGGLTWVCWLVPATMLLLIVRVTGIPPTEAQALLSRGDDYRDYQRTVSAFVPWPPRGTAS